MGHSSLVGIDRIPTTAPGHDSDALGPSDSSDSGSDVAGLMQPDDGGPDAPVDRATDPDIERPDTSTETVGPGVDSDSHGTGERRSAGGDAGRREAADISPDRIVSDPNSSDMLDDPSDGLVERDDDERAADAAALRAAESIDDEDEDDEVEDEDADPVGDPDAPPVAPARTRPRKLDDEGDDTVLVPPR